MKFQPYVPASTTLTEFTLRASILGLVQAAILGAANAYLGLKAGTTISAMFPAAVVSMLVLRAFKNGSILEENLSRTAASVGEALVAGAIFTLPAFVIAGVWKNFLYWESTFIMLVGGTLGILFVIFLRRTLCEDETLPFPESVAAAEIHKAGQKGATGAKYLFGSMGMAGFFALLKNPGGFEAIVDSVGGFVKFPISKISFLKSGLPFGKPGTFLGGIHYETPYASPAFMSVGYIIGPRLAALNFSGGVLAWLIFVPLIMFLSGDGSVLMSLASDPSLADASQLEKLDAIAFQAWQSVVRPMAVGAMLFSAIWTLYNMRKPLLDGMKRAFNDMRKVAGAEASTERTELDISMKWVLGGIVVLTVPMTALFYYFTHSIVAAAVSAIAMTVAGFVFSAVGGYLVGVIGGSSSPISGLALSSLVLAGLLLVSLGVTGSGGVAAVLAVAAVVCCASSMSGDIIQDLKVGQILGGTPRSMEILEIIAVVVTSFVLIFPIVQLHNADILKGGAGIGGENLPAPQASLMAMLSKGIVGGDMAWPLILMGIAMAIGLVMLGCESPMLVAVGMYLDFATVAAIFVGGVLRWISDMRMARKGIKGEELEFRNNIGVLLSSGMIAGEALVGVGLAIMINQHIELPHFGGSGLAGLVIFAAVAYVLMAIPMRAPRPQKS